MNIHIADANFGKLTSMHFYGWKKGLKTGMYYLRTRPAADAIKFTVDQTALKAAEKDDQDQDDLEKQQELNEQQLAAMVCSLENKDACVMCSG